MKQMLVIPIWIKIYWLILICYYAAGNFYEWKYENRKLWIVLIDTFSGFLISLFIFDFYQNKNESIFGLWVFPLTFSGIIWEFYTADKAIKRHKRNFDPELSSSVNNIVNYIGLTISNFVVVPGYIFGMALSLNEKKRLV